MGLQDDRAERGLNWVERLSILIQPVDGICHFLLLFLPPVMD